MLRKLLFINQLLITFFQIYRIFSLKSESIDLEFREKNNFFTIPMTIGSKQQLFEVQIDTTTCETWFPSNNTTYEVDKFDPKTSSTCQIISLEFEIDDEDGNVKGHPFYDSLTVGPYNKFGMVLVDSFQSEFKDFKLGKLGLKFRHEHGVDFNWLGSLKENEFIEKEKEIPHFKNVWWNLFTILPEEKKLVVGSLPPELEGEQ